MSRNFPSQPTYTKISYWCRYHKIEANFEEFATEP